MYLSDFPEKVHYLEGYHSLLRYQNLGDDTERLQFRESHFFFHVFYVSFSVLRSVFSPPVVFCFVVSVHFHPPRKTNWYFHGKCLNLEFGFLCHLVYLAKSYSDGCGFVCLNHLLRDNGHIYMLKILFSLGQFYNTIIWLRCLTHLNFSMTPNPVLRLFKVSFARPYLVLSTLNAMI